MANPLVEMCVTGNLMGKTNEEIMMCTQLPSKALIKFAEHFLVKALCLVCMYVIYILKGKFIEVLQYSIH